MGDRLYFLTHSEIDFYFRQSPETFVVSENPLYEFSNEGEHLILKVRKKNLTTWQMLQVISEYIGVKVRDIGYAGLKDKDAMTIQYISINKSFERELENFSHPQIKILEKFLHKNKLKIGHLKSNNFFIRLKKVTPVNAKKIDLALESIEKFGMPNYFGYQRFGNSGDNYKLGEAIVKKERRVKSKKEREFLINAYQSHLFNLWLSKRLEVSKIISNFSEREIENFLNIPKLTIKTLKSQPHPFKLLSGDIMHHYPYGKIFEIDNIHSEAQRFFQRDIVPTGLLAGKRVKVATDLALIYEREFIDSSIELNGVRRFAWTFPKNIEKNYRESEFWYEINFTLEKGSYATVLLEEIAHKSIN